MASDSKLKPCPFCGGDAEISVHGDEYELVVAVGCADCTARVRIADDTTTRDLDALERAAIAAWNRREWRGGPGMIEYAIRIGGYVWRGTTEEHDKLLSSMSGAKRLLKQFEDADKTYDVPNPPKRTIVSREVGPWKEAERAKAKA